MKRLFLLIIPALFACGGKNNDPVPPDPFKEQKEKTYNLLQGEWVYSRLEIKSIWKCSGNTGCTVLNPDGTVKDTTRANYDLTNSYWKFTGDLLSCKNTAIVGYSFDNKKYSIIGKGFTIQPYGGNEYNILTLTPAKVVITQKTTGPIDGNIYYEYYFTHYLIR
ncbi:hypothetical protein FHW36_10644 [Chitinophaga polysaccharea]|uniref:Lipocalin-like protein n=1 Tax=Chitinophaga polysaccharea TaxID=1293035 RepID=A0A561PL33_9BACT|nr:hypothetical protein [Chitinophaga polysaccharea]TWF38823.1 hypothetical protein FHW36_10644 [Chitinophaga polysaccharea]